MGSSIILVSNGHGEDIIGVALGQALAELGYPIQALPLVGKGAAYQAAGFSVLGPRQEMPSGGFVLDRPMAFVEDLRAGWLSMTTGQWRALREAARSAQATLVVGDIYALAVAYVFGPKPIFQMQPRVSVRAWGGQGRRVDQAYTGLERFLMGKIAGVYPRDAEGEQWLRQHRLENAKYLGNPMLDAVSGDAALEVPPPYLMLLPGSRSDAYHSLPLMLEACRELRTAGLVPLVVWAGLPLEGLEAGGWKREATPGSGIVLRLIHPDGTSVYLTQGAFKTVLAGAKLALSTSGTAAEQAAGFGVPLVGFATQGPQYTPAFAQAQVRLLGQALTLTEANPRAIAKAALALLQDPGRYQAAQAAGRAAMGEPGASTRIARDIQAYLAYLGLKPINRSRS